MRRIVRSRKFFLGALARLGGLALGFLSLLFPAAGAAAETRIRLATLLPRGSSHYHTLEAMGQKWRAAPQLEQRLAAKGFVVLFWADAGWVHIFSRQSALRPGDFKKTKVFVGASDNNEVTIVKGLGFQAVPLEWSDVLTSLQTGLVD